MLSNLRISKIGHFRAVSSHSLNGISESVQLIDQGTIHSDVCVCVCVGFSDGSDAELRPEVHHSHRQTDV